MYFAPRLLTTLGHHDVGQVGPNQNALTISGIWQPFFEGQFRSRPHRGISLPISIRQAARIIRPKLVRKEKGRKRERTAGTTTSSSCGRAFGSPSVSAVHTRCRDRCHNSDCVMDVPKKGSVFFLSSRMGQCQGIRLPANPNLKETWLASLAWALLGWVGVPFWRSSLKWSRDASRQPP